jgi:hypothetical protein
MFNKGDTLSLILDYTINDKPLEKDAYDEIELQLNSQSNKNSVKLLYTNNEIIYDDATTKYQASLSQSQTFQLKQDELNTDSEIEYQLRILLATNVISSAVGTFTLGPVLSSKVLETD